MSDKFSKCVKQGDEHKFIGNSIKHSGGEKLSLSLYKFGQGSLHRLLPLVLCW